MQTFVLEGRDRTQLRDSVMQAWDDLELTGEVGLRPLDDGRWRMEVFSERDIPKSFLERLGQNGTP